MLRPTGTLVTPPDLQPGISVAELRQKLTTNLLTREHLQPDGQDGIHGLLLGRADLRLGTFDRELADATPEITLPTYGHPGLNELLNLGRPPSSP